MIKILTCCKQGLVRSVGLADVLKMHFRPVDVVPIGLNSNSQETIKTLCEWADWVIIMEERYLKRVPEDFHSKTITCEVGQDTYGNSHNSQLIDKCWRWCREHKSILDIEEHFERI